MIAFKEFKVNVGLNDENKVIFIEPVNQACGKTAETQIMVVRLYTQDEIDKEYSDLMKEGRVYVRRNGRMHEVR